MNQFDSLSTQRFTPQQIMINNCSVWYKVSMLLFMNAKHNYKSVSESQSASILRMTSTDLSHVLRWRKVKHDDSCSKRNAADSANLTETIFQIRGVQKADVMSRSIIINLIQQKPIKQIRYDPVCIKDADLQSRRPHMIPLHLWLYLK